MIDRDEIEHKAQELDVHIANVERDYVFGWLLKAIFENEHLRQVLVFKGGNCLRKAYYPLTRFSSDLDFSSPAAIDLERVSTELNKSCEAAGAACGVNFLTERNTFQAGPQIDKTRQSYKGKIYFTDFSREQDNLTISIRVDVTEFDRLHLTPVSRALLHGYSDAAACQVDLRCMALEEIIANKMKCLIQRRHSHDLFDLVYASFVDRSIEVDRGVVLRTFFGKTIFGSSPAAAKEILLGIPMTFFGGVWEKYIRCPKSTRFSFQRAVEGFTETIESLFQGVSSSRWAADPFFKSEHRNVLMEAGAGRRLIRMTYDGIERQIEPYSLAYKRPQSGPAREYFYGYDLTGGRTTPPGIKSFVNTGVGSLELLEDTFEPRYEIELSKAGEEARQSYFGKPFSGGGSRVSLFGKVRRTRPRAIAAYKVECPYCQKRFTRSKPDTKLNAHKDSNGYSCRAKRGYLV